MSRVPKAVKMFILAAITAAGGSLLLPALVSSQEEVASSIRRYKDREASTGFYEEYEVRPRRFTPWIEIPGVHQGVFPYSPSGAKVRVRTRLIDSHEGVPFYKEKTCATCHVDQAKDIHTVRANLTCRQCHGGEPIASIASFTSPMNPIRKHAYVCAKCHPGAGSSYASYVVHEPQPGNAATLKSFPVLAYAFWVMLAIAVGTFAIFLPHTILWGVREFFMKQEKWKA
ncbi:MAG: hypothetical protein AB1659_06150 [Thermodesulfobacteriota bacterium]